MKPYTAQSQSEKVRRLARRIRSQSAFTMVEIAISLAVIGFALVAIIGILPTGMQVQRENREETIIAQDASVIMSALKSGAQGVDDLTNYITAITNYVTKYYDAGKSPPPYQLGYTVANSTQNGALTTPQYPITNGFRIVGLLGTPRYIPFVEGKNTGFYSNYVVAWFHSMSGAASEVFPQTNQTILDLGLNYRVVSEVVPYADFDRNWTNYTDPNIYPNKNPGMVLARSNYWMLAKNMQSDLHDVRLIFRWPFLPNGGVGNGRQVFRTMVGGTLLRTNEQAFPTYPLYFFQSRAYVKAP
jgi:type II secretory pathway pseudopilin PulG